MTDKEIELLLKSKIYRFKVDLKNDKAYSATAFVESPAIQSNFQYFRELSTSENGDISFTNDLEKYQLFSTTNDEQRICSGALLIPNLPIIRLNKNTNEYYYGVFTAEDIFNISIIMHKNGRINNTNVEHNSKIENDDVYMFESFIIDSNRGIYPPKGFEELPDGSLFASFKVFNDDIWNDVKSGKFRGFSIEGWFEEVELKKEKSLLDELIDIANQIID